MEKPQSAVEWLFDELNRIRLEDESENLTILDFFELQNHAYNKAKAMEKEQIIDAYEYGYWRGNNEDDLEPEEYYKNPYCNPNNKYYVK